MVIFGIFQVNAGDATKRSSEKVARDSYIHHGPQNARMQEVWKTSKLGQVMSVSS